MARKRIEQPAALETWNDVSGALARIGGIDLELGGIEISTQQKIDAAKAKAADASAPLREEKARLETQIASYVESNREELGDKKSKQLYFGVVGYRKSSRVVLPRAPSKLAEIVIRLRARGMRECIVTKAESVDKEALKKYPGPDIEAVGAKLEVKDTFWYEVDREHLAEN